jgi:hypothetical protein
VLNEENFFAIIVVNGPYGPFIVGTIFFIYL